MIKVKEIFFFFQIKAKLNSQCEYNNIVGLILFPEIFKLILRKGTVVMRSVFSFDNFSVFIMHAKSSLWYTKIKSDVPEKNVNNLRCGSIFSVFQ